MNWPNDTGDGIEGVQVEDFHAFMPSHSYIFAPTREMWPAASVNARLGDIGKQKANAWLDENQHVEQMTWAPGEPMLIRDCLISDGGWIGRSGMTCFNLYRPPACGKGNADKAAPWVEHIHTVYPDDADHIVSWLAHRVQRPQEKVNHALVLGGNQGIGKDTLLEPVKHAVGPWNFGEVSPQQMLGRFNGFIKNVILRVSEARDLGDVDRFAFYDHMKAYMAAPPDILRCDEKHIREYSVPNVIGVIITTNHKSDGLFLPPDDRRHYVAWSEKSKDDFSTAYWNRIWDFYQHDGGTDHITAYLRVHDLTGFNAKAPPPKTPAFWDIADANRAPEDAELQDALDRLDNPTATTLAKVVGYASDELGDWLRDRKNRRRIPHRMEECGYVPARNDAANDGLWKIGDKRQAIYVRKELSIRDRAMAAADYFERVR